MKGQVCVLEGTRALTKGDAWALLGRLCWLTTVKPLKFIPSIYATEKRGTFPLDILSFCE